MQPSLLKLACRDTQIFRALDEMLTASSRRKEEQRAALIAAKQLLHPIDFWPVFAQSGSGPAPTRYDILARKARPV